MHLNTLFLHMNMSDSTNNNILNKLIWNHFVVYKCYLKHSSNFVNNNTHTYMLIIMVTYVAFILTSRLFSEWQQCYSLVFIRILLRIHLKEIPKL